MKTTLRILMGALGAPAILISLSILFLGAGATGAVGEQAFNTLSGASALTPEWPATMDSELRFYAALFLAFGLLTLRATIDFDRHGGDVPWLALVFFIGGLGRALSWSQLGPPHPFFLSLMAVELAIPPLIAALWFVIRQGRSPTPPIGFRLLRRDRHGHQG